MIKIFLNETLFEIEETYLSLELFKKLNNEIIIIKDLKILKISFEIYLNFLKDCTIVIPFFELNNIKYILEQFGPKSLISILENKKLNQNSEFNHFLIFNNIKFKINYQKMCFISKLYENLFFLNPNQIFIFSNDLISIEIFEIFLNIIHFDKSFSDNILIELNLLFDMFQCKNLNISLNYNDKIVEYYLKNNNFLNNNEYFDYILNNFELFLKKEIFCSISINYLLLFLNNYKNKIDIKIFENFLNLIIKKKGYFYAQFLLFIYNQKFTTDYIFNKTNNLITFINHSNYIEKLNYLSSKPKINISKELINFERFENFKFKEFFKKINENSLLKILINNKIDLNQTDKKNKTILHYCVKNGNFESFLFLIKNKININIIDNKGRTFLHYSSKKNQIEITEYLIFKGININHQDNFKKTALHYSCEKDNIENSIILLNNGANLNILDEKNKTAFEYILKESSKLEFLEKLDKYQICFDFIDNNDLVSLPILISTNPFYLNCLNKNLKSVLIYCYENQKFNLLEFFIKQGSNIYQKDFNNKTIIDYNNNNNEITKLLNEVINNSKIFFDLINKKEINKIEELLNNFPYLLYSLNEKFEYALHYCTKINYIEIIYLFIKKGINLYLLDKFKRTALHIASKKGFQNLVYIFLIKMNNINYLDLKGKNPIHYSIIKNHFDCLYLLVKKTNQINKKDFKGKTPLLYAILLNNLKMIQFLIQENSNINKLDMYQKSLLYYTFENNNIELSKILINKGININNQDFKLKSILHYCCNKQNYEFCNYLINQNIDLNLQDNKGRTALHISVLKGDLELVELLIFNKINLNLKDNNGRTALHYSIENGYFNISKFLIEIGIDLNIQDIYFNNQIEIPNRTALHLAVELNHYEILILLINKKANPNLIDKNGNLPLYYSIIKGNLLISEFLINNNSNIDIMINNLTLLDYCLEKKYLKLIELIINKNNNYNNLLHKLF